MTTPNSMPATKATSSHIDPLLIMLLAVALSRLLTMAVVPLAETTESRYGEIARVMAETGDWITPWFDANTPFWGKPPLSFWLQALSFRLLGVSEFAARFPAWLSTLGTGWLIYTAGIVLGSRATARWSTLIFASMALTYVAAGAVMTDSFLVLGITLSIVSILLVAHGTAPGWRWVFFVGLAIGLLAKGPLVLALLGPSLGLWFLWSAQARRVARALPWIRGILLTCALSLPWYIAAELKTPGFIEYFVLGEHFLRFIDPGWGGDLYGRPQDHSHGTIWWYWLLASFPWGFLALALMARRVIVRLRGKSGQLLPQWSESEKLLMAAALVPNLFFTFSGNIIWTYPYPALPPLALLLGLALTQTPDQHNYFPSWRWALVVTVPLIVTLAGSYASIDPVRLRTEKYLVSVYQSARKPGESRLQYVGEAPFSARFYSGGEVDNLSMEQAVSQINGATPVPSYLALRHKLLPLFQSRSKASCETLTRSKQYTLIRCNDYVL